MALQMQNSLPLVANEGQWVAPNAEMEFAANTTLEGVCYAKSINFKTGSSFEGPEFLKELNIHPDCQDALITGTIAEQKSGYIDLNNAGEKSDSGLESESYQLKVYPNPTNNYVIIEGLPKNEKSNIRVYNSMGQLIKKVKSDSEFITIDLNDQPSGVYYIGIIGTRLKAIIKN